MLLQTMLKRQSYNERVKFMYRATATIKIDNRVCHDVIQSSCNGRTREEAEYNLQQHLSHYPTFVYIKHPITKFIKPSNLQRY